MTFDRLTWVGLMVVALGWALLFSGAAAMEGAIRLLGRTGAPPFDLAMFTQATILTGFGLAILGALQTGFGALKHFFDTVLERTARSAPQTTVPPPPKPRSAVERGRLKDRPYILFGDGTIEVETLLGVRRFTSLQEAFEFIGN
jgi:hypothetical protein